MNEANTQAETMQNEVFKTCHYVRELTEDSTHLTTAAGIELVRLAVFLLNKAEEIDSVEEIIRAEDIKFEAAVWGQLLMAGTQDFMHLEHKQYLTAVASHMGPDWLEWLRRDVAFMLKVESF